MTSRLYKEKKMKSSKKTPSIPQEIIFHVFSWLTVQALMRFRCISKYFNSLVSESYFMDIHQCHSKTRAKLLACEKDVFAYRDFFYTIEQNEDGKASLLHIEDYFDGLYNYICMNSNSVECVNGLFCFWSHARQPAAVICNPSTREKISLPYISNPFPSHYSLGFEPEKKIYKVLFTRTEYSRGSRSGIARNWILTLGIEESWNEIESIPRFFRLGRICINGVIYMLNGDDHKEYVIAFDLKDESFRTITLWKALHIYKRHYDLIEVKGNLAVLENTMINGEINMWILSSAHIWRHL